MNVNENIWAQSYNNYIVSNVSCCTKLQLIIIDTLRYSLANANSKYEGLLMQTFSIQNLILIAIDYDLTHSSRESGWENEREILNGCAIQLEHNQMGICFGQFCGIRGNKKEEHETTICVAVNQPTNQLFNQPNNQTVHNFCRHLSSRGKH